MGPKDRRDRERLETREKILAAAREMFAGEGFDAVTMRAIADRIEYTPTALYHHFPSKQALLTEICECDFARLASHFQGAATPDPIDRLRAAGEAYLRFAEEYPSQYRFLFMTVLPPMAHGERFVEEHMNDPERDAYAFLRQACADAIAQSRFRPQFDDADQVAQILWGSIHGMISLRMTKHRPAEGTPEFIPWRNLRESVTRLIDALLHGMLRQT